MGYEYDAQNIFAKILRGEIPNDSVYDSEHSLAFRDIAPQAPAHVLVIPRGPYVCYDHFAAEASDAEIVDYTRAIAAVCKMLGVTPDVGGVGYRLISNTGEAALQDVMHLHVHVLSGRPLGRMLSRV